MAEELERVPTRPSQAGTQITRAMTGVELELHTCAICTRARGVSDHHITWRSRGGKAGPTMPCCVDCHNKVHDGEWVVELAADGLFLNDKEGQPVWRLKRWPLPGEAGDLVQLLDRTGEVLKLMPEIAPALLPWQAAEVFRGLREMGEGGWRAQTRLLGEMYQWRMPGWSSPDKIEALCNLFGIRRSQVYNYVSVAESFEGNPVLEETSLSMGYAIEASRTDDPAAWMKVAEERKLEHPSFSRDDLNREIVRAGARKSEPEGPPPAAPKVWAKCEECGHVGWAEKLPVGSGGQPVDVEEYKDAEG